MESISSSFALFDELAMTDQWQVIENILNYLPPEDLTRLSLTSKKLRDWCVREGWPAPGLRRLSIPNYRIYDRLWRRFGHALPILNNLMVGAYATGFVGCTVLFGLYLVSWPELSEFKEALHVLCAQPRRLLSWRSESTLAWTMLGSSIAIVIGIVSWLSKSYLDRCHVSLDEAAAIGTWELWGLTVGGIVSTRRFSMLDEQIDWERIERLGAFSESMVANAKFLHMQRRQLEIEGDIHPLYRKWIELSHDIEWEYTRWNDPSTAEVRNELGTYGPPGEGESKLNYFLRVNERAQSWQGVASLIRTHYAARRWEHGDEVRRQIDFTLYNSDRLWFNQWKVRPVGQLTFEVTGIGGILLWIMTPIVSVQFMAQISSALGKGLRLLGSSQRFAHRMHMGSFLIMSVGVISLNLSNRHSIYARIHAAAMSAQHAVNMSVQRHDPNQQYPDLDFATASFDQIRQRVDWQVVNRYGLMERHLLEMSVAWSLELDQARANAAAELTRISADRSITEVAANNARERIQKRFQDTVGRINSNFAQVRQWIRDVE